MQELLARAEIDVDISKLTGALFVYKIKYKKIGNLSERIEFGTACVKHYKLEQFGNEKVTVRIYANNCVQPLFVNSTEKGADCNPNYDWEFYFFDGKWQINNTSNEQYELDLFFA